MGTRPELEIPVVRVFIRALEPLDNVPDYIPGARPAAPFGAQTMKFCIFTGPTLPAAEGQQQIDAIFLPPAVESDVYRAVLDRPVVIGLTGGYFERVPSVPYKQILRAMAQGIHVLGTSSIGALRAAELSLFVMEGVGAIYEMCARGHLDAARTMEVGR